MNTNIKTTLSNILAPLTGGKSAAKGTKTVLFDPNKSEFSEIVRKMRASHENNAQTDTPKNQAEKSAEDILGLQISAKLSELIANKGQKTEENSEASDIEAALSDIAAMIEASPEQVENLENLQKNSEITPESIKTIKEIKDFLVSVQQPTGEQPVQATEPPVIAPDALQTSAASPIVTDVPATPDAVIAEIPAAPMPEVVTETEQTPQIAAIPFENTESTLPKSVNTGTQNTQPAFSQLNAATANAGEADTQQQSNADSSAGNTIARQVAQAIMDQQQADAAVAEETPLRQMTPMPDQILNSVTDKADRPLAGDILQDITNTAETIADEPIGTHSIDPIGPTTDKPVLGKTDGPSVSNADIARQVQETIISSSRAGDKQVVIRLDPPELGQVTLRFVERPEGITGILQVEQPQTRQEIERALPEIIQNLQNASVQVKKVDVVQTPQQHFDNSRNESAFSGQQSGFQEQDGTGTQPHQGSYSDQGGSFENPVETQTPQMQWTDKSINMLI